MNYTQKSIFVLFILMQTANTAFAQVRSSPSAQKYLYDSAERYIGRLNSSNQVELESTPNSNIASVLFSFSGFWIPTKTNLFNESSLIIFYPKRDCRGEPFIKMDGATVPYLSYPKGLTKSGYGQEYYSKVEYIAPIQSTFGYKYLFSKRNLATNQCEEGTYFGYYMQGEKIQASFRPPFILK